MDISKPEPPNLIKRVLATIFIVSLIIIFAQLIQDHFNKEDRLETFRIHSYQQQLELVAEMVNQVKNIESMTQGIDKNRLSALLKQNNTKLYDLQKALNEASEKIIAMNEDDNILEYEKTVPDYINTFILSTESVLSELKANTSISQVAITEISNKITLHYEDYSDNMVSLIDTLTQNLIGEELDHRQVNWWVTFVVIILIFFVGISFYRNGKKQVWQQFDSLATANDELKIDNDFRVKNQQLITERTAVVNSQNMKLQSILDSAVDAIITITSTGVIDSFNKAAETMFDYPADQVIGKNIKILMPEPYHSEHDGYLKNHMKTGVKKVIGLGREVTAKRIDGTEFPAYLSVSRVEDSDPILFTGIIQDITKRKKVDQKLQQTVASLVEKQEQLDREEEIARHVFENITVRSSDALPEVASWCLPMSTFSGDMVMSSALPSGGLRTVLCDFTGHGLPAALGAMPVSMIYSAMSKKELSLEILMNELNLKLNELLPTGIFCCIAGVDINATRTQAKVWNAGLPEVLKLDIDGNITQRISSTHLPLGVMEYTQDEMQCEVIDIMKGDIFYLYSDGVTEAENEYSEMLGQSKFEKMLSVKTDEYGRLMNLRDEIGGFRGNTPLTDDLSLVEVKTLVTVDDIILD